MNIKALVEANLEAAGLIYTRPFAGSSLLQVKLEQLMRIKKLDGIIVNSDSEEMLAIAQRMGVKTVKRDARFSSEAVCRSDIYENIARNFNGDVIVYANISNPLVNDVTICNAIDTYRNHCREYDSLHTVHVMREFSWENGNPFRYDPLKEGGSREGVVNFAVSVLTKETMMAQRSIMGKHPYFYFIDEYEATDVNHDADFEFAEYCYKRNQEENFQRLFT